MSSYADTLKQARDRAHWKREERVRWEFDRLTGFPRPARHEREVALFSDYSTRGWLVCVGWTEDQPAAPIYDVWEPDENHACPWEDDEE